MQLKIVLPSTNCPWNYRDHARLGQSDRSAGSPLVVLIARCILDSGQVRAGPALSFFANHCFVGYALGVRLGRRRSAERAKPTDSNYILWQAYSFA
jgi:hypothetical protein